MSLEADRLLSRDARWLGGVLRVADWVTEEYFLSLKNPNNWFKVNNKFSMIIL